MAQHQLTPHFVSEITCPAGKKKIDFFDITTKGLVLEIRISGGKTYYLRYQDYRGKTRQMKLADANDVSLSQARTLAGRARNKIAMGEDPLDEKVAVKQVPTFAKFIDEQYLPFVKSYKRSWSTDVSLLRTHLLPRFGARHLDTITRQDIIQMHRERRASGAAPGSANRLLIMMRYIFNLALRWEIPGIKLNPTKGVHLMEENNARERFLSVEEAQQLYASVCNSPNAMLRHIVAMLILTGGRKREVLDAKWQDFDISRSLWRIPMTNSGRARHVPLASGAVAILAAIPRIPGCEHVFANPATQKPYVSIFTAWDTARQKAGLGDVRLHDLRHSFASLLINQGRTLFEVQTILGHTQVKTTLRYAHLSQGTLLDAANAATRMVGHVMPPKPLPDNIGKDFSKMLETRAAAGQ
jgi:integrase